MQNSALISTLLRLPQTIFLLFRRLLVFPLRWFVADVFPSKRQESIFDLLRLSLLVLLFSEVVLRSFFYHDWNVFRDDLVIVFKDLVFRLRYWSTPRGWVYFYFIVKDLILLISNGLFGLGKLLGSVDFGRQRIGFVRVCVEIVPLCWVTLVEC